MSTKHVAEYSAELFTTKRILTLYVGVAMKAIYVAGTSNCTSGANVSVVPGSSCLTLTDMVPSAITPPESFLAHKATVLFLVETL